MKMREKIKNLKITRIKNLPKTIKMNTKKIQVEMVKMKKHIMK